jgi:hypothetical protein
MPRPTEGHDKAFAADHGRIAAVESLIGLAQSQIAASLARGANIDTQALGLIGLIAVVLAAQGVLGPRCWIAIPGLAVSLVIAGYVLAVTRFDLGPKPEQLYAQIEAAVISGEQVTAKLLVDLVDTDETNQRPLRSKALRLVIAVGVLILTILYTALIIVL